MRETRLDQDREQPYQTLVSFQGARREAPIGPPLRLAAIGTCSTHPPNQSARGDQLSEIRPSPSVSAERPGFEVPGEPVRRIGTLAELEQGHDPTSRATQSRTAQPCLSRRAARLLEHSGFGE
jgi:hypothetical protein